MTILGGTLEMSVAANGKSPTAASDDWTAAFDESVIAKDSDRAQFQR